jgi:hypothetical protein
MVFWLVLKLETSYRVIISWRILVSFRGFFEDYTFAWWNIWVSIILLLPLDTFKSEWQGLTMTHPFFIFKCSVLCNWSTRWWQQLATSYILIQQVCLSVCLWQWGGEGYVSYFLEWPVPPRRKRKYVPIVPSRARTHAFPSLWGAFVKEWMNEKCPPVIISSMHHSPKYITTIPKFSRKKK